MLLTSADVACRVLSFIASEPSSDSVDVNSICDENALLSHSGRSQVYNTRRLGI